MLNSVLLLQRGRLEMAAIAITGQIRRRRNCVWRRGRRPTRVRRAGCWRWRWSWRGLIARRRPRPAGWIGRRCAIGCIATMPRGFGPDEPPLCGSAAPAERERSVGACRTGREGPGPGEGRRRALAPRRSAACDRGAVRRGDARAHGRQAIEGARLCQAVGAPAAARNPIPMSRKLSKKLRR